MKQIPFVSLVVSLFLVVAACSFATPVQARSKAATERWESVTLITSTTVFHTGKTQIIDFSAVSCCQILTTQYAGSGVTFLEDIGHGFATYQANGFANSLSSAARLPGAPTGETGAHIIFTNGVRSAGVYISTGTPFGSGGVKPATHVTVHAYDAYGRVLLSQQATTCAGGRSPCPPMFLGVSSSRNDIKAIEYIMNDPYSWSFDNLTWEI